MAQSYKSLTASQMYEEEAKRWEATGQLQRNARLEYLVFTLRCWLISSGAKADGVSERLTRYCAAAESAFERQDPNWYEKLLRGTDMCSVCGETYRLENLSSCTHCVVMLGYCHQLSGGRAANGNPKCPDCRMGEIVG